MNKQVLKLAIPSILANVTIPLVGMVDTAIVGHLADASIIGGIAIGTMLFDLLYWNFAFLRVGTSGLTAQAYGAGERHHCARLLTQSLAVAIAAALFIYAIQWAFVWAVLQCVPCSTEAAAFARQYFFVRVWAAPCTLALMALKGWFIGMQDTVSPMVTDIVVNVVNMVASYLLAVKTPMGAIGVAYGTVIAQVSGLAVALVILMLRYRKTFDGLLPKELLGTWQDLKHMMHLNGNLFIRSLCFMVIYVGFTALSARWRGKSSERQAGGMGADSLVHGYRAALYAALRRMGAAVYLADDRPGGYPASIIALSGLADSHALTLDLCLYVGWYLCGGDRRPQHSQCDDLGFGGFRHRLYGHRKPMGRTGLVRSLFCTPCGEGGIFINKMEKNV